MSHNIFSQAEQARENARQTDGKFGTYAAAESGASLSSGITSGSASGSADDRRRISELSRQVNSEQRTLDEKKAVLRKLEAHDFLTSSPA